MNIRNERMVFRANVFSYLRINDGYSVTAFVNEKYFWWKKLILREYNIKIEIYKVINNPFHPDHECEKDIYLLKQNLNELVFSPILLKKKPLDLREIWRTIK